MKFSNLKKNVLFFKFKLVTRTEIVLFFNSASVTRIWKNKR